MPRLRPIVRGLAPPLAVALAAASLGAVPAAALPAGAAPDRVHVTVHGAQTHAPAHHGHASRGCADADTPVVGASSATMRGAVVCLINRERTRRGLPALSTSSRLDRSAQGWTGAMVAAQSFDHGADFSSRITAAGFVWRAAGENIATGYPTPTSAVQGWMASTGHCQNILNPQYSDIGTGVNRRPVKPYASGPATWTQDFALPMSASAPSGNWGPSGGCPYSS